MGRLTESLLELAPSRIAGYFSTCELCLAWLSCPALQVQMLGSGEMDQEVVGAKGAGGEWTGERCFSRP